MDRWVSVLINASYAHLICSTIPKLMKSFILVKYRKNAIFLILAPYLINVRKLPYQESFNIIKDWLLNKCNALQRLDPVILRYRLKLDLDNAIKIGYKPIRLENLRERNRQVYNILSEARSFFTT